MIFTVTIQTGALTSMMALTDALVFVVHPVRFFSHQLTLTLSSIQPCMFIPSNTFMLNDQIFHLGPLDIEALCHCIAQLVRVHLPHHVYGEQHC